MALEIKITQKLSQSLLMTPQLQQAIKLLQLGRLEYQEAIEQELLENPVLEEFQTDDSGRQNDQQNNQDSHQHTEDAADTNSQQKDDSPVDWEDYLAQFTDSRGSALPKGNIDHDDRPSLEATLAKTTNLSEHLLTQIRYTDLTPEDMPVVLHIIGNLNRNGLLCATDEELAEACEVSTEHVQGVLSVVQSLDPIGIAARDLPECLFLQLDGLGYGSSLAAKIVTSHIKELENRKYDQIARKENVSVEAVYEAIKLIRTLEPRPAKDFTDEEVRYVTPDIYVYKDGEEYVISLNEDGLPRLRVSPYYLSLLQNRGDDSENGTNPNKQYLTERLKAASWLIKSIHQRQQTIYKVTESIVKFQRDFLDNGIEALKPLVLKDVADDIGMHESTVSRVTTNKFVHTPQGVFELKFFFSTGIQSGTGSVSSNSVKEKIKNIISTENPKKPISDQAIVEFLAADNVTIARRTVAKYRESLGILSSSKRKKLF